MNLSAASVAENIAAKVDVVNVLNGAGLIEDNPGTDETGSYINLH